MPERAARYDVFVPGEDIPRALETDVIPSAGDVVTIDGRDWIVERVEPLDGQAETAAQVHVAPPHEPA